jgi:hypothetical protein
MNSPKPNPVPLLAGDGGVSIEQPDARDPFEVLDDLMAVVELLCPTWPAREVGMRGRFRL